MSSGKKPKHQTKIGQKGFARLGISEEHKNYFGKALKEIRKELGLTQIEAAAKLKVTQSQWSAYEIGKSGPNLDVVILIAEALKIDILDLIKRAFSKAGINEGEYSKNSTNG